jgi:transposase
LGEVKKIFNQVLPQLAEEDVINIKDFYIDATRIEANANCYTSVWCIRVYKAPAMVSRQLQ